MSYSKQSSSQGKQNSKQSSSGKQAIKPFCKVCYDAGKTEREYTSHFVKSKPGNDGKVVCPYLLSLECTYCKKKEGHTASHCPMLAAKKATQVAESKRPVYDQDGWEVKKGAQHQVLVQKAPVQVQAAKPQRSTYSVLAGMMQQEEQQEIAIETKRVKYDAEFPGGGSAPPRRVKEVVTLTLPSKPSWGSGAPNWSVIAKKAPAPQPKIVQQQQKQQQQPLRPIQEDDAHSVISEDDRATPEPSSPAEKSWGWSGDWNDCPN
jgi:Nanos RNA binding domain